MTVKNLELSAQQIGDALGVCQSAASRKIEAAESLLCEAMLVAGRQMCKSQRTDRVRSAVVERLRTVAAVAASHPDELEPWIGRLMDEMDLSRAG